MTRRRKIHYCTDDYFMTDDKKYNCLCLKSKIEPQYLSCKIKYVTCKNCINLLKNLKLNRIREEIKREIEHSKGRIKRKVGVEKHSGKLMAYTRCLGLLEESK